MTEVTLTEAAEAIGEGTPYVIDADKCVDCGACAASCPNEAIAPA